MAETVLVVDKSNGSRIRMAKETFDGHAAVAAEAKAECRYAVEPDQKCEGGYPDEKEPG